MRRRQSVDTTMSPCSSICDAKPQSRVGLCHALIGKGKATVAAFKAFLEQHGGKPAATSSRWSATCLRPSWSTWPSARPSSRPNVTVDWFACRPSCSPRRSMRCASAEAKHNTMPKALRLGRAQGRRRQTDDQASGGGAGRTRGHRPVHRNGVADQGKACAAIRKADGVHAARWPHHQLHPPCPSMHRLDEGLLEPVRKALANLRKAPRVASFSAGRQATATPAWRASTVSSKPLGQRHADTETPPPTSP